ncbi:transcription factor C2H2 [Colletotrichum plurivorum]|uniref:Transcription factor C2H2 n=1 Tax=Colletotrichum plurivorum TaxID=2175906 RepID=A0A8H6KPR6_9PEZI|nr:transcription factor C2H2 [Colletotrichum plurivorum]
MPARTIAALALSAGAAAAAGQRFAAVDMSPAPGLLVPRFFIDAPILAARDGPPCPADAHSCVDIGHPGSCCVNSNYCYVRPDNTPWCCPIGSKCNSNCEASQFQCTTVVAVTLTPTNTDSSPATTTVISSSTSSACCGRVCPGTSTFRCAASFGGGCCPYGATCASGNRCVGTVRETSTTLAEGAPTPADPRCTATTQHACEDGEGCCDNLRHCTRVSGAAVCAPGNPTATGVVYEPEGENAGGLSAGAKAGIGVGVAVVGCGLIAFSAWFCLVRRRRRRGATTASERSTLPSGRLRTFLAPGGGASATGGSTRPGRSARAMSEVTSASRPTVANRGATQDYFGPDAVAGPYTDTDTVASYPTGGGGAGGPGSSPGRHRGVPLQVHSPSDVVAPVEIDSRVKSGAAGFVHNVTPVAEPAAQAPTTQGRFELYGSEMLSPSSPRPPMPSPPLMTPRSVESAGSVSMMERSPTDRSPGPPSPGSHR